MWNSSLVRQTFRKIIEVHRSAVWQEKRQAFNGERLTEAIELANCGFRTRRTVAVAKRRAGASNGGSEAFVKTFERDYARI